MEEHRSAARFDFRARLQLNLDDVDGRGIVYGHAIDYVNELLNEPGTHLHASMAGWEWPATWAEVMSIVHAEAFLNLYRDRQAYPDPLDPLRPWPTVEVVSEEERAHYEQLLAARSAFAD